MNSTYRTLARSVIIFLVLLALTLAAISFLPASILRQLINLWPLRSSATTPPPPTVLAPRGAMPTAAVGLQEWALYKSDAYRSVGSGFLLALGDGTVIGVTTAHSVGNLADPANLLTQLAFGVAGREGFVIEFDSLYGRPGVPRAGDDLTVDYLLLKTDGQIDAALVLSPDPRGGPQPGERVSLYNGAGDSGGNPLVVQGTVASSEATNVWVLMDPMQYPGGMSGSPLVSNYTGMVVGMAIATTSRGDRYLVGFHPIGSIVAKAAGATEFPDLADYP